MRPGFTLAISTSIALVATQAAAAVASQQALEIRRDYQIDAALAGQIDAALARRDARMAVDEVLGVLLARMTADGMALGDMPIDTLEGERRTLKDMVQLAQLEDATSGRVGTGGEVFDTRSATIACHSNCHSNCHGSRGWR